MSIINTAGLSSRLFECDCRCDRDDDFCRCNCQRIRNDRDDLRRRTFICREAEEVGVDGIRRVRLICREIDRLGETDRVRGTGIRFDDFDIVDGTF